MEGWKKSVGGVEREAKASAERILDDLAALDSHRMKSEEVTDM